MKTEEQALERSKRIYRVLRRIYKLSEGNTLEFIDLSRLAEEEDLTESETQDVFDYLTEERLVKSEGTGRVVSITYDGIVEIENTIADPQRPTEHFSVQVTQRRLSRGPIDAAESSIQDTGNATGTESQDGSDVIELLKELREIIQRDISQDRRQEVWELVDGLEQEARSSPDRSKARVMALAEALRHILKGSSRGILGQIVVTLTGAQTPENLTYQDY